MKVFQVGSEATRPLYAAGRLVKRMEYVACSKENGESTLVINDVDIQKVGCELTTEPGRLGIHMTSNVVVEGLAYALEGARECQRADKVISFLCCWPSVTSQCTRFSKP